VDAPTVTQPGLPPAPAPRRVARLAFWLFAFLAPFAFIAALDAVIARYNEPPVASLTIAEFQQSDAARPQELAPDAWQRVTLGHAIRPAPGMVGSAWYRLRFVAPARPVSLWSVYLPRPYANVAVFVNGELIGDGGPMTAPLPVHRDPLRFTFPARLLHPGVNEVAVRTVTNTTLSGLGRIYVAPAAQLEPAYDFGHLMFVTIKQVIVIMMTGVAVIMAAMYLMRRRDSAFGWFALALVLWAAHIGIMLTARAPFDPRSLWETFQGIAIGLYSICAALFIHRFLGLRRARLETAFFAFAAVGSLVLLSGPLLYKHALYGFFGLVWVPVIQAIGIYQLVLLLRSNRQRPDPEVRLLAAASWFVIAIGARDFLVDVVATARGHLYLTYAAAPVFVVFGAILLRRFVNALDASERANEVLEGRVAEKSRELELNLGRLKDMERDRALSAERERIMQDMHDGIGGQLVQALSIATSRAELQPMEESLRNCLDELRLMIDSIEPVNGDLASVLGTLRMRMSRRLAQGGIEMRWQVGDLPPLRDLGPKHVLEITRIVQEAITNALKHSGSRQIRVAALVVESGAEPVIRVEIGDDGRGFQAGERGEGTGRGLAGMRRRAATLGAQLAIETGAGGTTVRLELPAVSRRAPQRQAREHGQPAAAARAHSDALE
jgi:signal transduction histidine kinase